MPSSSRYVGNVGSAASSAGTRTGKIVVRKPVSKSKAKPTASNAGSAAASAGSDIAAAINRAAAGTPMAGTGQAFVTAGVKYGVNPGLLAAIAKQESQFGTRGFATNGSHNPFGLGVTGAPGRGFRYQSWEAAIDAAAKNLAGPLYKGAGKNTVEEIGKTWAADPGWARGVQASAASMGIKSLSPWDAIKTVIGAGKDVAEAGKDAAGATGDAVGGVVDGVGAALGAIADTLKFLANPHTWLRIGEMILGVIGLVGGGAIVFRGGSGVRPIGLSIMGVGAVWVYFGVKDVNPKDELLAILGAPASLGGGTPKAGKSKVGKGKTVDTKGAAKDVKDLTPEERAAFR